MGKTKEYQLYISSASAGWYHVFTIDDLIFKVVYNPRSATVQVLKTKPKGLKKVKMVMPYSTPYSTIKNIIRSYKQSDYKSRFNLIYPFVR